MLVRIGDDVWEADAADVRRFGADAYAFKVRAPSARVAYIRICGEWFANRGPIDDTTRVTDARVLARIHAARVLKEGR